MLVGYTRVSKADGSQTTDLQHDALIAAGADRVALPIDAATPALYAQVKGHSIDRALALIRECAARHPGHISTHLIAGLGETEEDILRLAAEMISIGVTCGLFAFTPIPGTRMAHASPPTLDSYRRVQLGLWLLRPRPPAPTGDRTRETSRTEGRTDATAK